MQTYNDTAVKLQTRYISYLLKKGDQELSLKKSQKYHFKALKFVKKYKLKNDYAPVYLSIAVAYQIHEKYHQALIALNLAQRYPSDDMSYDFIIPMKLDVLFHNEKLAEARELAICSLRQSGERVYETSLALSEIYLALRRYHKAMIYGKESLEIAWREEYMEGVEQAYHNLIDIYRQVGDSQKAQQYIDETIEIGLFEKSAMLQFAQYNYLVTQKSYDEAKALLPQVESNMREWEYQQLHIFYSITLQLFKESKDKEGFDSYFSKFLTTSRDKENYIEKWLSYAQAGDFYRELQLYTEAIGYYQKMAYYLEQVRLSSLNRDTLDRVDFFRDKYHYLLDASLFLYTQKEYNLSFYFLECSKSATLRDRDPNQTLAIQQSNIIKGYL